MMPGEPPIGNWGRGGMATVSLAEDLTHRWKVALKTLTP
jgi:hypothetical protein